MERRSLGTDEAMPPTNQCSPIVHGQRRKRQRSNPGLDTSLYDDVFGGGSWRYSPVSDPDIDYNIQSSKRYLSEVMANNLTRHMSLRPSSSAATDLPSTIGASSNSVDDMLGHAQQQGLIAHLPSPNPFGQLHSVLNPDGPGPITPPGGCSPQRTCISEMSEGLADPGGDILQPMNTSDASISVSMSHGGGGAGPLGAKASVTPTPDSTSETADSELLDERERSVSLSGMLWASGSGLPAAGFAAVDAGVSLPYEIIGTGRPSLASGTGGTSPGAHCGLTTGGPGAATASPFFTLATIPRRLSDASQGAVSAGVARGFQQQQQQQQQQMMMMMMRGPYSRGHVVSGRGVIADIPTSPSDTRFGGLDLRKTALLRSISRRAEETTSDGSTAAATAVLGYSIGGTPNSASGVGVVGVLAGSVVPECSTGLAAGTATLTAMEAAVPRCGGAGNGGRPAGSRSDSGFSDGMSDGGGSGGCGGGVAGMELSSNSADGGGGIGLPVVIVEEHLDQQHGGQQRHEQQALLQQLLMQQQQEGSGEAQVSGQVHHVQIAAQPSHLCSGGLQGVSCADTVDGSLPGSSRLQSAHSCSRVSLPLGPDTSVPLLSQPSLQTQVPRGDGGSSVATPQNRH